LRSLHLGGDGLERGGIGHLVACPHLESLRELSLNSGLLDADCVAVLAGSTLMGRLTSLTLATSTYLGQSHWAEGPQGVDAARALARSPMCRNLQTLNLSFDSVGDSGAGALAGSPHLSRLTALWLDRNGIGDAGARALAASASLAGLKVLVLADNPIGPAGRVALAARFGSRVRWEYRPEDYA
jgi:hypothetical protein